ncbi:MAG: hypothetical protein WCA13_20585 [Terriglobales bacterium]
MNLVGFISTAVLSLTLVAAAPTFAQEQHEQQEEQKAKPAQEEKKAQPEKSVKQEEKPAVQPEKNSKQGEKSAPQEEKTTKQQEKNAQQQDKNTKNEEKNAQQQEKNTKQGEKNAQQQHNAPQANPGQQARSAGGNGGGRIPEASFRAHFGRQHTFRVTQADYSNRRFQYGGYWFGFADPWPSNWLYTQDVFVVEIDGVYYLCNAMYPGVNITLSFTL